MNMQMRMDIAELFGSLGEATAQVRKAAARAETLRNLKQVGEALLGQADIEGLLLALPDQQIANDEGLFGFGGSDSRRHADDPVIAAHPMDNR